ncbi:hypothetical protein BWQ96_04650 [Gracilariopsis chorda]|uniref:Uncharacterized protein n=1 Tax=Gracilariopsis chorda TaxID=448386 RepID=A0A2V3ITZ5_9FLOR|nr:hypothetical protein BWQ96_04650 [Gracilariopsis chorda]|eukprot:PXF45573.1 hypothetical protein BWQ96_04650 [Gracilariopsis chorda]
MNDFYARTAIAASTAVFTAALTTIVVLYSLNLDLKSPDEFLLHHVLSSRYTSLVVFQKRSSLGGHLVAAPNALSSFFLIVHRRVCVPFAIR